MADRPTSVLLLDDDDDEIVIIERLLRRADRPYRIEWESDVDRALGDMRAGGHDVYLVDYQLGPQSGLDVLRAALASGVQAPIILLTGAAQADVDVEALRRGAADYLSKNGLTTETLDRAIRYAKERAHAASLHERLDRAVEEGSRLEAALLRVERLQDLTAALSDAVTPDDVGQAVMDKGLNLLGAFAGVIFLIGEDRRMRPLSARGVGPERIQRSLDGSLEEELPLTVALREGRPFFFENRHELVTHLPHIDDGAAIRPGMEAGAMLPLLLGSRRMGVIGMTFAEPRTFSPEERAFAQAVAQQCAQALERTLLMEEQRRARERAQLLADASAVLATSLEAVAVLENLAGLVVPGLADWCAMDLADEGVTRQVAAAHVDPGKVSWVRQLEQKPGPANRHAGIVFPLPDGQPQLHAHVSQQQLAAVARDDEHRRTLEALGVKSAVVVPLSRAGRMLGALTLVRAGSDHRYGPDDLSFALEVANRAALAVENARLFREAQEAIRARDEFLSVASHELRTPLTSLSLNLESLGRSARSRAPIEPERLLPKLATIDRQVDRLTGLVSDLLDVSRAVAGRFALEVERVDVAELARETVERLSEQARQAGTPLGLRANRTVGLWDRLRLEQILTNLVTNAIKFGEGKPVEIEVSTRGDRGIIVVRDHGIGIGREDQARIFQRFERAVSARHFGGLGLGLWIVRQIVEALGGTIVVESAPGHGATFTVELPTSRPGAAASPLVR